MDRRLLTLGALVGVAASVAVACSLGLDESLLDRPADGGTPTSEDGSVASGDASTAEGGSATPTTCAKDEDCASSNGCLRGKCDLARKACVFDVCRAAACNAGVCDTSARACRDAKPYPLRPAQFKVGAPAACSRCIAAVHPYVFVGTATGVVAFNVSNPTLSAPPPVALPGLSFVPTALVASGSRVFAIGSAVGPGPTKIPFAWIDVPSDPFATQLRPTDMLAGWNRPAGEGTAALAREGQTALVFTGAAQFPAAVTPATLGDRVDLAALLTPMPPGSGAVSMSGTRLLVQALDANGNASFGFVPNVGTPQVSDAGLSVSGVDAGSIVGNPQYFGQSGEGGVIWSYAALTGPAGAPGAAVRAVRAGFLVAGAATSTDASQVIDVEPYPANTVPPGTAVTGPVASLDANTAMVVTAARESLTQLSVQFLTQKPLGLVRNADNQPRRAVLPVALGAVAGATGSNGVGYLIANEAATAEQPANASVYVFDPACAP